MQIPKNLLMMCVLWCFVLWCFVTTTMAQRTEVWIRQPVDHFGSNRSDYFNQRCYIDWSYRDGQPGIDGMPVLVYIGGESAIDGLLGDDGIVTVAASRFQSLVVYVEHRFYGQSIPLNSIDAALADTNVRSCLTSDQALADLAKVITELKANLSIPNSPVITFGGSYAGMLAARFRMIYPNITRGSLASSASVLMSAALPAKKQYCYIVSRDFENESEKCYKDISRSWGLIDEMANRPDGLRTLSQAFSMCSPLTSKDELKIYLAQMYDFAAQYNGISGQISKLCRVLLQSSKNDLLKGVGDAVLNLTQHGKCNDLMGPAAKPFAILNSASVKAWNWQVCNELAPYDYCGSDTMFERTSFDLSSFGDACFIEYGSYPHPLWNSTIYNGRDLKTTTNIIFSNGLLDPYSGSSIVEDISQSVIAITTKEGSHCLDMEPVSDDDPQWLKHQREEELRTIAQWLNITLTSGNDQLKWATSGRFLVLLVLVLHVF